MRVDFAPGGGYAPVATKRGRPKGLAGIRTVGSDCELICNRQAESVWISMMSDTLD